MARITGWKKTGTNHYRNIRTNVYLQIGRGEGTSPYAILVQEPGKEMRRVNYRAIHTKSEALDRARGYMSRNPNG